jgi:hypothetical protein
MLAHTNDFKKEIAKFGKQINVELKYIINSNIQTEDAINNIITEDELNLETERDLPNVGVIVTVTIPPQQIDSVQIIKNGNLLQSLMQQCNLELKKDSITNNISVAEELTLKLGVLVGNSYEYIDYGSFNVYSKEYNADSDTWRFVCYDKMLWAMKKYTRLNVSYPLTVRNYLQAIADRIGIEFGSANEEFTNYDKLIYKDYFIDKDVTYRDILDKLSELTASNILIKSNQLKVAYPVETNDVIDKNNLKNINVSFGKTLNPINKINLVDTENDLYFAYKNDSSIQQYGLKEINITNNPLVFNNDEEDTGQNILDKLDDLVYTTNDFATTGICYYEFLDLFTVSIDDDNYKCLLLNNEINISQGIEENIFTEELKNTQTETNNYENNYTDNKDIQEQITNLIIEKISRNNIINAINQTKENSIIKTDKFILKKEITDTTDANGFLDTGLSSDYILISATANFNSNNYGFIIPYYYYNNNEPMWKLKIKNQNEIALANTEITVTAYYIRKD